MFKQVGRLLGCMFFKTKLQTGCCWIMSTNKSVITFVLSYFLGVFAHCAMCLLKLYRCNIVKKFAKVIIFNEFFFQGLL